MDNHLQSLLRRYASGEEDLAHPIVKNLLRSQKVDNLPQDPVAYPPKSIDDLLNILTCDIIPLGILAEWEDDHVACGRVEFVVQNKRMFFDLNWCGSKALAAFEFADSKRAYEVAVNELRHSVLILFEVRSVPILEMFKLKNIAEITAEHAADIRCFFYDSFNTLSISLTRGYSRADLEYFLSKWGQTKFQQVFGPIQHSNNLAQWAPMGAEWGCANRISIESEGTFWCYGISAPLERIPLEEVP